jgi:hypothetical protein
VTFLKSRFPKISGKLLCQSVCGIFLDGAWLDARESVVDASPILQILCDLDPYISPPKRIGARGQRDRYWTLQAMGFSYVGFTDNTIIEPKSWTDSS